MWVFKLAFIIQSKTTYSQRKALNYMYTLIIQIHLWHIYLQWKDIAFLKMSLDLPDTVQF